MSNEPKIGFGLSEYMFNSFSDAGVGAANAQQVFRDTNSWAIADASIGASRASPSFGDTLSASVGDELGYAYNPETGSYKKKDSFF